MPRALATLGLIVVAACSPGAPSSILEGQELMSRIAPPGTPIGAARRGLAEAGVSYSDVSVQDGNPFFLEPKFAGHGGPAIWAELNASVRPWNPFNSPSLVAFLAFSESELLVSTVVSLEGGDR
jgi:hypothetical protein